MITPLREDSVVCPLLGMFADGKISSEKFIEQKQNEKELELWSLSIFWYCTNVTQIVDLDVVNQDMPCKQNTRRD